MSSTPYVGEIRMFGGNFEINGWAYCDGRLLDISQNSVLFNLIGTTYGGDGQQTFALPDLRGRVAYHQGSGYVIGQRSGVESVTLTSSQMPQHNHALTASTNPVETTAAGTSVALGQLTSGALYTQPPSSGNPDVNMAPQAVNLDGGNQPHDNRQPYLCVNFIISLFGVFPSQN